MSEQISITRALKELSVLDKRLMKSVDGLNLLDITQGKFKGKALKSQKSISEFEESAKSSYESFNDLLSRRGNLKNAIVTSNANTQVIISGVSCSVAEAIEKKTSIGVKKALLRHLRIQKARLDSELENSRATLNSNLDRFIEQNLGKDRKTNKEDFDNIAKPYIEANEVTVVDPVGIASQIETLESEIEEFETNVDIVLSESNAKTTITI